ncbi:MAG TPA: glutamyl-tRNA reductase [Streptosporangiaceae bacterium]|jgi:glutamyl-tRNA reductase
MSVLVVGLSHRSAPVPVLERAAVSGAALTDLLHGVHDTADVTEAIVMSTCNRVEVYAEVGKFHGALAEITGLLARCSGVPHDELTSYLYVHYEQRAVQHLFAVVCGLDSMAVGEPQILGQVRQAWKLARDEATIGRSLGTLAQKALRVGKRAHAETGLDQVGASLVGTGLRLAERHVGPLAGTRALIVGAGSMSALSAATLARRDMGPIVVANRTPERAARLTGSLTGADARAVGLEALTGELATADVVVSCTGASGVVVTADAVREARAERAHRPLVLIDLALPHDVDPAVRDLPGVELIDLAALRIAAMELAPEAEQAVDGVRTIIAEEVAGYLAAADAARVAPTVVALRSRAAEVVDAELARLGGRLPDLDPRAQAEVAKALHRVVDKLLHAPTVRVKELASSPGGDTYAAALRELFDLDPKTADAVTRADVVAGETLGGEGT